MQLTKGNQGPVDELTVLTVCGVGMGTSLILRMTAEKVFSELGLRARVTATDASSARSMPADVVIGQELHTAEFEGRVPVVVAVDNFLDTTEMRTKLLAAMEGAGWLVA
jgi:PTS system ascorbate-specific IIB component